MKKHIMKKNTIPLFFIFLSALCFHYQAKADCFKPVSDSTIYDLENNKIHKNGILLGSIEINQSEIIVNSKPAKIFKIKFYKTNGVLVANGEVKECKKSKTKPSTAFESSELFTAKDHVKHFASNFMTTEINPDIKIETDKPQMPEVSKMLYYLISNDYF